MEKDDKIRGVTLRVAIFFGLTTFTLCIAIFYIESILDDTRNTVNEMDSLIENLRSEQDVQLHQIQENENEIRVLRAELNNMRQDMNTIPE
jgi:uncharacterized protein (DUF3084 family)